MTSKKATTKKAVKKTTAKKAVKKATAKKAVKKSTAKKAVKKTTAKKAVKKTATKKAVKKTATKKAVKKTATKKAPAKKAAVKKAAVKKAPAKKAPSLSPDEIAAKSAAAVSAAVKAGLAAVKPKPAPKPARERPIKTGRHYVAGKYVPPMPLHGYGTSPKRALKNIRKGLLVAYPTETCWALGADANSAKALAVLRKFKGRKPNKPIAVLCSGLEGLRRNLVGGKAHINAAAERLAEALWPGPLTLVLRCDGKLARSVGQNGAVGFRCSSHFTPKELVRRAEKLGIGPLTATSLNRSGEPECVTRKEARECMFEAPGFFFSGPEAGGEPPSAVVDCTGVTPRVLREGPFTTTHLLRIARGAKRKPPSPLAPESADGQ